MNITAEQFINLIAEGKTENELNKTESLYVDNKEYAKLRRKPYELTHAEATEHLQTDWTNGFTILYQR